MSLPFVTHPALTVPHGFFTREGGVSTGPYASLNCSLSGADDRASVLENRARVARALGAEPSQLVGLMQVHGTAVATVTEAWAPGQGPQADAMVTATPRHRPRRGHRRLRSGAVRRCDGQDRRRGPCRLAWRRGGRAGGDGRGHGRPRGGTGADSGGCRPLHPPGILRGRGRSAGCGAGAQCR